MTTRRKRSLNFLPAEPRAEPVIDIGAYPVDIGVGELMRLTRERLGHELQSVANQLRIRLSYLEAIEESRFRDLPGTTYAVGFVRSYADYLGLDGADVVRRFREEAARIHGQTKLILPALSAEGKLPRAAVLLVSVVAVAVLYGAWYYRSSQRETELPLITEVPDRLVALTPDGPADTASAVKPLEVPSAADPPNPYAPPGVSADPDASPVAPEAANAPAVSPAPRPETASGVANAATPGPAIDSAASENAPSNGSADVASSSIPTVAAPEQPAPAATDASAVPAGEAALADTGVAAEADMATSAAVDSAVPSPAEPPPAADPPEAPPASTITVESIPPAPALPAPGPLPGIQQAAVTPAAAGTIVLEARMDSWIKVVDADGKTVTSQVLKAGERYEIPDQPGLILRTGNAGGLDVLVGGRKAPPLGEVGAVFQKIVLERDRLLDGTAVVR
jgi:cytoskeleton protein RodZ